MIESKGELRKRGVKSPDRAEALMLAFADRTPGIMRYYEQKNRELEVAAARRPPENLAVSPLEENDSKDDMERIYEEALRKFQESNQF